MNKFGRILVGTRDIANNIYMLKCGFQELGFNVTSCSTKPNKFYNIKPDINISDLLLIVKEQIVKGKQEILIPDKFSELFNYDTYIFVTESLFPGMLDLPILRSMGKRIIFYITGSDVRFWGDAFNAYKLMDEHFPIDRIKEVRNSFSKNLLCLENIYTDTFSRKLHTMRMIESHSDVYLSVPGTAYSATTPYIGNLVLSLSSVYKSKIHFRNTPLVIHVPSSREKKSTKYILECIEKLKNEGIAFHFELIENASNQTVLNALAQCDILIDQIGIGKGGLLALEAHGSGCCVLGLNSEDPQPIPYRCLPRIGVIKKNFLNRLRTVLTNKNLRIEMAEAGIEYTRLGINSPANVAQYLLDSYDRAKNNDYDYYPTFFFEHSAPPEGEHVPEYLKQMTWQLMKKHGVAPDFKPKHAFMAGHLPKGVTPEMTMKLPRWDESKFRKKCFWGWWAKDAIYPHGPHGIKGKDDVLERLAELSVRFQN